MFEGTARPCAGPRSGGAQQHGDVGVGGGEAPVERDHAATVRAGAGREVRVGHLTVTHDAPEIDLTVRQGVGPEGVARVARHAVEDRRSRRDTADPGPRL